MKNQILLAGILALSAGALNAAELPFEEKFANSIGEFTTYDAKEEHDSTYDVLKYYSYGGYGGEGTLYYNGQSSTLGANDWLFSPSFTLEKDFSYQVEYKYKISSSDKKYKMEWYLVESNDTPPSVSTPVHTLDGSYTNYSFLSDSFSVVPEQNGNYYIAMHLTSEPAQGIFYLDNFTVSAGVHTMAPQAPTATYPTSSVVDDKLAISFDITAPTYYVSGSELPQSGLSLKVARSDDQDLVFTKEVEPGGIWKFTDPDGSEKNVQYFVSAIINDLEGEKYQVNSNPYIAYPAAVQNFVVTQSEGNKFSMKWDAVTTASSSSGVFLPKRVTYTIKSDGATLADNLTGTNFEYVYEPEEDQEGQLPVTFSVLAVNSAGSSTATDSPTFLVGEAYKGEFFESFAGGRAFTTNTWLSEINSSNWKPSVGSSYSPVVNPQDEDGGLLTTNSNSYEARLLSPVINMEGLTNVLLKFYMWHEKDYFYTGSVSVGFRSNGKNTEGETFMTKTEDLESGWYEKTIAVPEDIANGDFQIYFYTPGESYSSKIFIDNISVKSYPDHSLSLSELIAPATLEIGHKAELTAVVNNSGLNDESDFSVTFYADGVELGVVNSEITVEAQKDGSITFEFTALPKYAGKTVELSAVLAFANDYSENDNEANAEILVNENALTQVTEFTALPDDKTAILSWKAPEVSTEPTFEEYTESFEDYELGATEGLNGWIFVDNDGEQKYKIGGGYEIYGVMITGEYTPSYGTSFLPLSGNQAATFGKYSGYSYPAPATDSWIISPEVAAGTEVSFNAFGYYSYGSNYDTISLMWSEGSEELDDFTLLHTFSIGGNVWQECSATLPENAKRFAIRYNGNMNNNNIAFDDITYTICSAPAVHSGYNVYRNHELIATLPVETTYYEDNELEDGTYSYYVTALYDKGESNPCAASELKFDTSVVESLGAGSSVRVEGRRIIVQPSETSEVVVTDLAGRLIAAGNGYVAVSVNPGIYVIAIDGKAIKLLVK